MKQIKYLWAFFGAFWLRICRRYPEHFSRAAIVFLFYGLHPATPTAIFIYRNVLFLGGPLSVKPLEIVVSENLSSQTTATPTTMQPTYSDAHCELLQAVFDHVDELQSTGLLSWDLLSVDR